MFFQIAAFFALVSCLISFHSIWKHLKNYKRPDLQRLIVRILLMPVIYALCSCLSFGYSWAEAILDPIRDCYEAFVLWMFFQLLIYYMGGESSLLEKLDDGRLPTRHAFPFHFCLKPVDFAEPRNFVILKRAILQFVIVKPLQSLIIGILRIVDVYQDGIISDSSGFIYVGLIYNFSVMACMYGLVMFYITTSHDLVDKKPVPKFLCIKAVIFFSFWQSLVIAVLYKTGLIETHPAKAQDFVICFEMIFASIAHNYAFSHSEYAELDSARLPWPLALRDVFGTADLWMEIQHTFRGTNFRGYNDLINSGVTSPLLSAGPSSRLQHIGSGTYVGLKTQLEFEDVDEADAVEEGYRDAKDIGEDHGYRVISPKLHIFSPLQKAETDDENK